MITVTTKFDGLDELTRKLKDVGAASQAVFMQAAEAGGQVVQREAISNAPGPHIGIEVTSESERAVASVGPVREKWFYRFSESGTKEHGPKHKKTRLQSYLRKIGSNLVDNRQSMMRWFENGRAIFARRVRGVNARPFLKPAIERVELISEAVGKVYMDAISAKTGAR